MISQNREKNHSLCKLPSVLFFLQKIKEKHKTRQKLVGIFTQKGEFESEVVTIRARNISTFSIISSKARAVGKKMPNHYAKYQSFCF
jgi:hypothetical protein